MRRVWITGLGIVCSLGRGREVVWQGVMEGRRGFRRTSLFETGEHLAAPVGEAPEEPEAPVRRAGESRLDRMVCQAALEALEQAGLRGSALVEEFGVSLGTSNGGLLEAEEWFRRQVAAEGEGGATQAGPGGVSASALLRLPSSSPTDRLASITGTRGPRLSVTTACSSSAASIALAAERIRDGEVEGMIAGGGDPLCRLTYSGFAALRLLDPEPCRPFAEGRRGLTLGEGAGILVLEEAGRARERGGQPLAEVLSHGASCDAHHMTSCHPEGRGMAGAMREALDRAGVAAERIGYVNAHGTATPVNDSAEATAIASVFGEEPGPPVSSTKSMHGHLLGGSGAVEAALAVMAIREGRLPSTAGLEAPDPGIRLDLIRGEARSARPEYVTSNSFGFGGGNVVLLLAAPGEAA